MIPTISREQLDQADDPAALVRTVFSCAHPDDYVIAAKRLTRAGWYQRVLQCQICGGQLSRPMTADEKLLAVTGLPDFNSALGEDWIHAEIDAYDLARGINNERKPLYGPTFTPEYRAYLDSPEWRFRRESVLKRDRHTCQACGNRRADHVHHLSYRYLFREPLFDLVAVCSFCHQQLHDRPES